MEYESLKDELLSTGDTALKHAESLDSTMEYEIFLYYYNSQQASIQQGIVSAKDGATTGNAVRVSKGKKVGFASASGISLDRIKFSIREAMSVVEKTSSEDEQWEGFADPQTPGKDGLFSKDILSVGIDDLIKKTQAIIEEAQGIDERVKVFNGQANTAWGAYAIINSRGIAEASRGGFNYAYGYVMSIEGEERKTGFGFDGARDRLFEIDSLGKTAVERAVEQHGAEELGLTGSLPVIWGPRAADSYIIPSIAMASSGKYIVEGISPLCDMIGDTIASSEFTLVDNGQMPEGWGTNAIDHEGIPQQKNVIVDEGVLKTHLFDTYYGRIFGMGSTGNCERTAGFFGGSTPYEETPAISIKTLSVAPGSKSFEDILSSIDGKAIYITESPIGIFHSSIATGEFSCVANSAFLVEKGDIVKPLKPVSVAGNFYEGFKNILHVGSDIELTTNGVFIPSIAIDELSVTG